MYRRKFLRTGIGVSIASVAGCLSDSGDPAFQEGFEEGIGEWESDAAIESEVDIDDFDWVVEVSDEVAAAGDYSLRIWNEGDYDDGVS